MTVDTVDTETGARCEVCILLVLIGGVILRTGCVVTTRAGEKGLNLKTKVREDFTIIEKVPTTPSLGWNAY